MGDVSGSSGVLLSEIEHGDPLCLPTLGDEHPDGAD